MRASTLALALAALFAAAPACAHGPQLQITNDNGKIVTRQVILEEPYSSSLTPPKSVYVMPLLEFAGAWYSRPNNVPSATVPGAPEYPSGPGFAWGYDMVDGGPQAFAEGSVLSVSFTNGLQRWNGTTSFVDAGDTQLKAFRGSNANISSPPENFAITSDGAPFDSVSLAATAANYEPGVHGSLRFALLGDGASPTSASPDGVYLLSMQLGSTQAGLSASDPYYFVLHKNAAMQQVRGAVKSLDFPSELVQWIVPEPGITALVAISAIGLVQLRRRRRREEG
jgi:hypothetical protein